MSRRRTSRPACGYGAVALLRDLDDLHPADRALARLDGAGRADGRVVRRRRRTRLGERAAGPAAELGERQHAGYAGPVAERPGREAVDLIAGMRLRAVDLAEIGTRSAEHPLLLCAVRAPRGAEVGRAGMGEAARERGEILGRSRDRGRRDDAERRDRHDDRPERTSHADRLITPERGARTSGIPAWTASPARATEAR